MPGSPVGLVCLRDVMRAAKREIGRAAWGERVEFRRVLFRSAFFIFSLMGTRAEILRKRNARQSGRTGVPARCHARRETRRKNSQTADQPSTKNNYVSPLSQLNARRLRSLPR